MDTAVYWVEHVTRHGGKHLQPQSKDLPLYRYFILDVFAILAIGIFTVSYILYKFLAICLAAISGSGGRKKKND